MEEKKELDLKMHSGRFPWGESRWMSTRKRFNNFRESYFHQMEVIANYLHELSDAHNRNRNDINDLQKRVKRLEEENAKLQDVLEYYQLHVNVLWEDLEKEN